MSELYYINEEELQVLSSNFTTVNNDNGVNVEHSYSNYSLIACEEAVVDDFIGTVEGTNEEYDDQIEDVIDGILSPTTGLFRPNTEEVNKSLDIVHKRTLKRLTRKRKSEPAQWQRNVRKTQREQGNEYVGVKGTVKRARVLKDSCRCRLKCYEKFTAEERQQIHEAFWKLSDSDKSHFYNFVERIKKSRTRTEAENSKKTFTYLYHLPLQNNKIRVCKIFYLNTLDISQMRINYFFSHILQSTGVPRPLKQGKHKKKTVLQTKRDEIRKHIESFPCVESHYCRANSKKKYLESGLNLKIMYELYCSSTASPAKIHIYRSIFNNEYNLSFHKPKKDRCDTCEAYKYLVRPSDAEIAQQTVHIDNKIKSREIRNKDRIITEDNTIVVCFDLENVFNLPRANVSNFFYKRKFSVYNLTAHCSSKSTQNIYNCLWHELIAGRAANHISSALIKTLNRILLDLPSTDKIILWSDACVPQNRNQIMTMALKYFMKHHPTVKVIMQRYSEPGHGNVQEVDAVHSKIERFLKDTELFSPLGLYRMLNKLANRSPAKIINVQMSQTDFHNYQHAAKSYNYSCVPYTQVKEIRVEQTQPFHVTFKKKFEDAPETVSILRQTRRPLLLSQNRKFPIVNVVKTVPSISKEKKEDLIAMYSFMPLQDKLFYTALIK